MQKRQIFNERKNTNTQTELTENKQDNSIVNRQSINQDNNNENKQSFNLSDLGLSSAFSLLIPEPKSNEEQQIPMKRKKKKPKRGFRHG